jgi:hypothetical protein
MESAGEIIRLLTEIRDNQQRQLEAYQTYQRDYTEFYKAAMDKQQRRALFVAILIGVGVALILLASL